MTPLNGPTGDHLPPVLGRFFQHDEAAASIVLIYESVIENTGCEPVDMSHQCTAHTDPTEIHGLGGGVY